jgi:hypothetical protein
MLHIGHLGLAAKLQAKNRRTGRDQTGDELDDKTQLIIVIGRGHSGTRAISHTLSLSDVYMGNMLNASGDLLPPQAMYDACRVIAKHVKHKGGLAWDFKTLHKIPIPDEFSRLVNTFLSDITASLSARKGWKLPETTLALPWIVRMFPNAYYIHWVRDPRDAILAQHLTDDLAHFGVPYPRTEDVYERRAISWKYQHELVKATPKPKHWLTVRFEDFVLMQDRTLKMISDFLGFPIAKIPVKPEVVGRYRTHESHRDFNFLQGDLHELGYVDEGGPAMHGSKTRAKGRA